VIAFRQFCTVIVLSVWSTGERHEQPSAKNCEGSGVLAKPGEKCRQMANIFNRPKAYVSFQVRISPELKEKLMHRSFETGVSQGSIVIVALEHYLDSGLMPEEIDGVGEVKESDRTEEDAES